MTSDALLRKIRAAQVCAAEDAVIASIPKELLDNMERAQAKFVADGSTAMSNVDPQRRSQVARPHEQEVRPDEPVDVDAPQGDFHLAELHGKAPAAREADERSLPEVDVDGRVVGDYIELIGKATHVDGTTYRCLANVTGNLCVVEVSIKVAAPTGVPQDSEPT
jgi:hypothetical protein